MSTKMIGKHVPLRSALVTAAVVCLTLLTLSSALADGNGATTFTQTVHDAVTTMDSTNPCTNVPGTVTLTFNGVFHMTVNKAGDFWGTANQAGDFAFVPTDTSQPSYTGHFHAWFGISSNNQNGVDHMTFQVDGIGSDGSQLRFHEVAHMSISASGIVESFDKPTCG